MVNWDEIKKSIWNKLKGIFISCDLSGVWSPVFIDRNNRFAKMKKD